MGVSVHWLPHFRSRAFLCLWLLLRYQLRRERHKSRLAQAQFGDSRVVSRGRPQVRVCSSGALTSMAIERKFVVLERPVAGSLKTWRHAGFVHSASRVN